MSVWIWSRRQKQISGRPSHKCSSFSCLVYLLDAYPNQWTQYYVGPQVMYLNLPPWQYIQNQTVLKKVDAFLGLVSRIPEKKRAKNFEYLMQPSIWCLSNIIHRIQRDTMEDQVHIIWLYPLSGLVHRIGVCMDNACDLWLRSLRVSFVFFFNDLQIGSSPHSFHLRVL